MAARSVSPPRPNRQGSASRQVAHNTSEVVPRTRPAAELDVSRPGFPAEHQAVHRAVLGEQTEGDQTRRTNVVSLAKRITRGRGVPSGRGLTEYENMF
jgi:hypothetical protein